MTDQLEAEGSYAAPKKVGERLAEARKAANLDLADIATRTRIPQRHLEAIEEGRYGDLPAITYCSGFTKAYARALGLDEVEFGRDVRAELEEYRGITHEPQYFEPADPARVPTRALAWTAALLAVLLIGGYAIFRGGVLDGLSGRDPTAVAAGTETLEEEGEALAAANDTAPTTAPAAPAAAPATGAVVLTATQDVWLRIYEPGGKRLFEKTMATGETFQVPDDAANPQILTGRPDALRVTVGGQEVAPLGPPEKTIADVGVSAAALAARPAAAASAPTSTTTPGATPSASNAQTPPGTARP